MVAPVSLAEQAFDRQPYTMELFEGARAYLEALRPFNTVQVHIAKTNLSWMLWHQVGKPDKKCWTAPIQQALHQMPTDEAFAWQWR